jgi:hypothetical protein
VAVSGTCSRFPCYVPARAYLIRKACGAALLLGALTAIIPGVGQAKGNDDHEQPDDDRLDHTIIVGVGGAAELELGEGSLHPGANVMVEWDAIENWLELEIGASMLAANRGVEAPIDLLVKKPFKLASWAEFMVGVGPEVVRVSNPTTKAAYFGAEAALDFMFWPWGRRVGLWVEPEYDVIFNPGASSGIGTTGGVLFGW